MAAKKPAFAALAFIGLMVWGYEDLTHQALTKQAVEMAKPMIGTVPYNLRQQVIDGASKQGVGEDYTKYEVHRGCPVGVKIIGWPLGRTEPLSHFMPTGFGPGRVRSSGAAAARRGRR